MYKPKKGVPAAVRAWMKRIHKKRKVTATGKLPGPPRLPERCPCGESSRKRAVTRSFDCCKQAVRDGRISQNFLEIEISRIKRENTA